MSARDTLYQQTAPRTVTVTERSTVNNVQQPTLFCDVSFLTNCWDFQKMRRVNISLRLYVGHPLCCKNGIGSIETVGHCCFYISLHVAIQQTAQFKTYLQLSLLIFPSSFSCNCCNTFQSVSLAHNLHFQPATSPSTSLLILQFGATQNKYIF